MSDWSEGTPLARRWRTPARVGAVVLPLVSCAILSTFRDTITAATAVLILVLWVVAAAASGDRLAGLLAAVSGGVWFDFFLTEPYQRFTIADSDDIEATVLLVVIGACVTEIALWGHRQQGRAARRSGYLEGVLGTAKVVSEGDTPPSALIEIVARQITDVLGADTCRFVAGPILDTRIASSTTTVCSLAATTPSTWTESAFPPTSTSRSSCGEESVVLGHFLVSATSRSSTRPGSNAGSQSCWPTSRRSRGRQLRRRQTKLTPCSTCASPALESSRSRS